MKHVINITEVLQKTIVVDDGFDINVEDTPGTKLDDISEKIIDIIEKVKNKVEEEYKKSNIILIADDFEDSNIDYSGYYQASEDIKCDYTYNIETNELIPTNNE